MQSANTRWHRSKRTWLLSSCQFVWGKVGCNSGRYAISWDHRRIVDAGGRYPQRVGGGRRKATVVRDYLFRRETQVAEYINRTSS